jgi:hypothetical protein
MRHIQIQMPQDVKASVFLSSPSVSGGKDWVGILYESTGQTYLTTRWGKKNNLNQQATKLCTTKEYGDIVADKIIRGYSTQDTFDVKLYQWQSVLQSAADALVAPKKDSKLNINPVDIGTDNSAGWDF